MAWRIFRKRVYVDNVLRRFGYNLISKCDCCTNSNICDLQHVFCTDETTSKVWLFFQKSLGLGIQVRGVRQVCYDWWGKCPKSKVIGFIAVRLPMFILWEL